VSIINIQPIEKFQEGSGLELAVHSIFYTIQGEGPFCGHPARNGQNNSLDSAIKSMIDSGYLAEVSKDKLANKYKFHGKAYLIVSIN